MTDSILTPSFPALLQRFFVEHLAQHRAVSTRTIAAYRDTFRLLLGFAEAAIGKASTKIVMTDLDAKLILAFLDHLEKDRKNAVRSRNARLAALRSFLKYATHHDLTALVRWALGLPASECTGDGSEPRCIYPVVVGHQDAHAPVRYRRADDARTTI